MYKCCVHLDTVYIYIFTCIEYSCITSTSVQMGWRSAGHRAHCDEGGSRCPDLGGGTSCDFQQHLEF